MEVASEPVREQGEPRTTRRVRAPLGPWAALGAILALGAALLLYAGRGLGFFKDEWDFLIHRPGWSADALLAPSNEHLALVPALTFKVLLELFGLESQAPYRVVLVAILLVCALLLFLLARKRIGDAAALVPVTLVVFFGAAWENLLWPGGIAFLSATAAGLAALLALDRPSPARDLAAGAFLGVSLAASSIALAFVAAAAVEVLATRARLRRSLVVVVPLALYALWRIVYRPAGDEFYLSSVFAAPRYMLDAYAALVGSLVGLGVEWGRSLVPFLTAAVILLVLRRWRGRPPLRFWSLFTGLLVFWGLSAVFRGHLLAPGASRYLLPAGVLLLLALVELLSGWRPARRELGVAAAAVAVIVVANLGPLGEGRAFLEESAERIAPALGAMELARDAVEPTFRPTPVPLGEITAGPYFAAIDRHGSPADTPEQILQRPPQARATADRVLARAHGLELLPGSAAGSGDAPEPVSAEGGAVRGAENGCLLFRPEAAEASVDVRLPQEGAVLRWDEGPAPALALRRFAERPTVPLPVPEGGSAVLRLPRDEAQVPWHAQVRAAAPVEVCGL